MFPATTHLLLSGLIAYVILSLIEQSTQRFLMHQQKVAKQNSMETAAQIVRVALLSPFLFEKFAHEKLPLNLIFF